MGQLLRITVLGCIGLYAYMYFFGSPEPVQPQNQAHAEIVQPGAQSYAGQTDEQAFGNHLRSLEPQLESIPAGLHTFTAPSGKNYSYRIKKSGLFYCPRQKKNIHRYIDIDVLD